MRNFVCGWLLGLGLLVTHLGCCGVPMSDGGYCDVGCGDPCGDCGGLPFAGARARLVDRIRGTNCNSGCGEVYWDEQINEPPVCDPCGCGGEYDCNACGSCPNALGRLRQLWGRRYYPSNCGDCATCEQGVLSSGGCSDCAYGYAAHAPSEVHSMQMAPAQAAPRQSPTPAVRQPETSGPAPTPDPNAMRRRSSSNQMVIGSGAVPSTPTTVKQGKSKVSAKPVSVQPSPSSQGRRLVTNPRQ